MQNKIVEFLASYGPQPAANNLYDEFVLNASKKYGCSPLEISQPRIYELVELFKSENPMSVILTGTAGDGKTYTARKVAEELGQSAIKWKSTEKVHELKVRDVESRTIHIIKDLSELREDHKDRLFDRIRNALLGESNDLFLICVNDGQLLKFFRDREEEPTELNNIITYLLQNDLIDSPNGKFKLINMSRQSHQDVFDELVDSIVDHPNWSGCEGCPALTSTDSPCPIRSNLEILRKKEPASMRERLKDLIRIAAADRKHLSIRQLILLTVNILLGDMKPRRQLLNCNTARRRANENEYHLTNPYSNAFGDNLGENDRNLFGAFEVLARFGIGKETNNYFDDGLLQNRQDLPQDELYGQRIFERIREKYRKNPTENVEEFHDAILNQRRRLFFSLVPIELNKESKHREDLWNLTEFKHGATYIQIVNSLSEGKGKLLPPIPNKIICGINRILTGEMTTTDDRIWLTKSSGVFRGAEIPLLVQYAGKKKQTSTFISFPKLAVGGKAPELIITPNRDESLNVCLELRPTMVECLLRIVDGALPSSFSNECIQDIHRFQLKSTAVVQKAYGDSVPPLQIIHMVGGKLQCRPIDLNQSEEGW